MSWHQLKACPAHITQFLHGIRILLFVLCGGILQICQWYRVCDAGALRAEPLATLYILRGHNARAPSAEMGRGPPQAAWRGAVEHPSGGPSAPGRRCWRLGRKRPSPFSNSGPTPLRTLRPEFGGPKSLRCCCAKGVGHRAQLMLRARRGDGENNHPVPLLRTPTPQSSLSPAPHTHSRGRSRLPSLGCPQDPKENSFPAQKGTHEANLMLEFSNRSEASSVGGPSD